MAEKGSPEPVAVAGGQEEGPWGRGGTGESSKENHDSSLAGVAQWNECRPGSIPSRGTCLGCRPGPPWGVRERQPHTDVSLFLFLPPFPPF